MWDTTSPVGVTSVRVSCYIMKDFSQLEYQTKLYSSRIKSIPTLDKPLWGISILFCSLEIKLRQAYLVYFKKKKDYKCSMFKFLALSLAFGNKNI